MLARARTYYRIMAHVVEWADYVVAPPPPPPAPTPLAAATPPDWWWVPGGGGARALGALLCALGLVLLAGVARRLHAAYRRDWAPRLAPRAVDRDTRRRQAAALRASGAIK